MPDDASGHTDVWERLAAMNRDGAQWPSLTFRDESERLDFHIEVVHLNILANLWKIDEYLKLLERFTDRRSGTAGSREFTLEPSPLALSRRPRE